MTVFKELQGPRAGSVRVSISACWTMEQGWNRFTLSFSPARIPHPIGPGSTVYRDIRAATMLAAGIFGERYDCL